MTTDALVPCCRPALAPPRCKLPDRPHHRRLDIIIVRSKERAAKTIYFTGCTHFNREIKQRAENMGMYLDDNGLYNVQVIRDRDGRKVTEADLEERCVALANEKAVFDILNMKFIEPHDRKVCRCSSAVLGSTFTSAAPST